MHMGRCGLLGHGSQSLWGLVSHGVPARLGEPGQLLGRHCVWMALAPFGSTDWAGGSFPSLGLLVWEMGWESGHLGSGSFCG